MGLGAGVPWHVPGWVEGEVTAGHSQSLALMNDLNKTQVQAQPPTIFFFLSAVFW